MWLGQERRNNRRHAPPERGIGAQLQRYDAGTPARTCSTWCPHPR